MPSSCSSNLPVVPVALRLYCFNNSRLKRAHSSRSCFFSSCATSAILFTCSIVLLLSPLLSRRMMRNEAEWCRDGWHCRLAMHRLSRLLFCHRNGDGVPLAGRHHAPFPLGHLVDDGRSCFPVTTMIHTRQRRLYPDLTKSFCHYISSLS